MQQFLVTQRSVVHSVLYSQTQLFIKLIPMHTRFRYIVTCIGNVLPVIAAD
jgi:hypothetical protein